MSERRSSISLRRQARNATSLAVLWCAGLVILAIAGLQRTASLDELFLDPAQLTGSPWYTGLLSNLGILAWAVATIAAGGGAWVALRAGRPTAVTFLASAAMITTLLLLDDLLQVHAVILPETGMHPTAAQLMVVAPAPLWAWLHRVEIARSRWLLLLAALAGFAVSLGADQFVAVDEASRRLLLEDGAKLLGVLAWAQYFVLTARDITGSVIEAALGRNERIWSTEEHVRVP